MRDNHHFTLFSVLVLALVVTGCSKKKDITDSNSASESSNPAATATTTPSATPATTEVNSKVQDLQLQVDAYQKIYKRKPASLAQMVQEGFLPSMPPAPPGKRFTYDPASARVSLTP